MWRAIYHRVRGWAKRSDRPMAVRTEITVETSRIRIVRTSQSVRKWCAECGCEVDMVEPNEAEALWGAIRPLTAQPSLPGYGTGNGWHWSEASNGLPLICLESLLRLPAPEAPRTELKDSKLGELE
jgi:hypothetical protein